MNNIFGHLKGKNLGRCSEGYETTSLWQVHNHFTIMIMIGNMIEKPLNSVIMFLYNINFLV